MSEKFKNVMIAAGGTGGHIFTGVAIAEEFVEMLPNVRLTFVGTRRGLEQRVIPSLGWQLVMMGAPKYKGMSGFRKLMALIKVPFSILSAVRIVSSRKPDILVSIGGYASGPLSIAAWLFRVPIVLIEPNAIPGMANKLVGRFARLIFVAFDEAKSYFNSARVIKYGVPVRKVIREAKHDLKDSQDIFTIFVFGGSQGAKRLNESMKDAARALSDIKDKIKIIHQTGSAAEVTGVRAVYDSVGIESKVFGFTDRIWDCYRKADFVIARSGAATVAEISALAIPSALVPYPYAADDHQMANADALVKAGGATVIRDRECSGPRLSILIREMVTKPEKLIEMHKSLSSMKSFDASKRIVGKCMDIMAA